MTTYNFESVEKKWAKKWVADALYSVTEDPSKEKYYPVGMLPYPSGRLHMGHVLVYSAVDSKARIKRMQGYNVLNPIGWDAFGLPAENAAIKHGIHPAVWTEKNIVEGRRELKRLGFSFDWKREISSCDPDYYRWTQWFFLLMYKHNLAERREGWVNWCPSCNTVLANEQVEGDGICWRCSSQVQRKRLTQWFLKITEFADELWQGLDELPNWPNSALAVQRNWIGRSEGVEIQFPLETYPDPIITFTTRPDTIYGATFIVLAPEHSLISKLADENPNSEIAHYVKNALNKSELVRVKQDEKTGVFLDIYAKNPLTGERIPVWVADYVVASYGSGAVMGVPAHDARDMQFANKYGLPIRQVILPPDQEDVDDQISEAYEGYGRMINSGEFNGQDNTLAMDGIKEKLLSIEAGRPVVSYKLRDWLISRQRYWGSPIPIVYCKKCGIVPVPDEQLPVLLPEDVEFLGASGNVLEQSEAFLHTPCPKCNGDARRETDTMDTFMCSSWYTFRYLDPHNTLEPFSIEKAKYWLPLDYYVGLVEHAGCHMIYFRFFVKMLRKYGYLPEGVEEPVYNFFNNGIVKLGGHKMSKSRGNVVTPQEIVDIYGADALKLYILSDAPPNQDIEWHTESIHGALRYIQSLWTTFQEIKPYVNNSNPTLLHGIEWNNEEYRLLKLLNTTIHKIEMDVLEDRHNTAISALRILTNAWQDFIKNLNLNSLSDREMLLLSELTIKIILLLAPLASFLAEEMWNELGFKGSVHIQRWPIPDPVFLQVRMIEIVVQVDGRKRKVISVSPDAGQQEVEKLIQKDAEIQEYLQSRSLKRIIYIPKRLINYVTK